MRRRYRELGRDTVSAWMSGGSEGGDDGGGDRDGEEPMDCATKIGWAIERFDSCTGAEQAQWLARRCSDAGRDSSDEDISWENEASFAGWCPEHG